MNDVQLVHDAFVLKESAGAIELVEGLLHTEQAPPPAVERLLDRVLHRLDRLGTPARDRDAVFALLLRGEALRALGRLPESIAAFQTVANRDHEVVAAWVGLGWCHKRTGRLDLAIDCLRQALTASPDEPLLHYNLACYLSLSGDVAAAVEHLTRAISREGRYRTLTMGERDFDPIRSDPRFLEVTRVAV
ncbi:MAG: TPR end-of-group domain-containing protein [Pirellulales bacterium]|jgi:tetratricopeptide (TPR) repeat protein